MRWSSAVSDATSLDAALASVAEAVRSELGSEPVDVAVVFVSHHFASRYAEVPVLQISMPSEDPEALMELGRRLAPLRDEGVLIMGSGFMTHSFEAIRDVMTGRPLPQGVVEFDRWAAETLARRDIDSLIDYRRKAPAAAYAHRTVDHFVPLFIAAGASLEKDAASTTAIEGFWMANSKRSVEFR